jgi:hypothetical protein
MEHVYAIVKYLERCTLRPMVLVTAGGVSRLSDWLTHSLTPWNTVLPVKLTATQLVKKFPACYGTRRVTTVFIRARHRSLSWARCSQSTPSDPISLRSILIISYSYVFRVVSSLQIFQPKQCIHFSSLPCVLHAAPVSFSLISSPCVIFRNKMVSLQWRTVSPSPKPPSWRTTPCRLSPTAYSVHSQLPANTTRWKPQNHYVPQSNRRHNTKRYLECQN